MHNRKGNLFHRPFRHVVTTSEEESMQTVVYIHANAVKYGLVTKIEDHKWSSYRSYISGQKQKLLKTEVVNRFGGRNFWNSTGNNQHMTSQI